MVLFRAFPRRGRHGLRRERGALYSRRRAESDVDGASMISPLRHAKHDAARVELVSHFSTNVSPRNRSSWRFDHRSHNNCWMQQTQKVKVGYLYIHGWILVVLVRVRTQHDTRYYQATHHTTTVVVAKSTTKYGGGHRTKHSLTSQEGSRCSKQLDDWWLMLVGGFCVDYYRGWNDEQARFLAEDRSKF